MTPTFNGIIDGLLQALPSPSPLDPLVLQSILLCIVAGEKHLILHAPAQDVRLVVRVVVWIFTVIFEYPTHKLKIKPRQVPLDTSASPNPQIPFLRSLFLPQKESQDDQQRHSHSNVKHPRPRYPKSRHNSKPLHPHDAPPLTPSPVFSPFGEPHLHYPYNHPPVPKKRSKLTSTNVTGRQLPRALVVSGLHHASTLSQCALAKVLLDKRVVLDVNGGTKPAPEGDGVWNLPDGFIVVYVCPWDTRERPAIHKTLLDKFAMSATVVLRQGARHALNTLSSSPILPPLTPSISLKAPSTSRTLFDPLIRPDLQEYSNTIASPQSPMLIPPRLITTLQKRWKRTIMTPNLSLYLSDLFSAIRHHPELDGTLLTVRSMNDAVDLAKAYRVLGLNVTGTELIRSTASEMRSVQEHEADDFVGKGKQKQHDREESKMLSPFVHDEGSSTSPLLVPDHDAQSPDGYHSGPSQESVHPPKSFLPHNTEVHKVEEEEWGISEADVARAVPRVVTHRLRARDGPHDQILASLKYGALFELEQGEGGEGRRTIKSILVEILTEV